MLHAIKAGKSKHYRRYLGDRDGSELRVAEEDEITSTVFGPLDFISATDANFFWRCLLEQANWPNFLDEESPDRVTMRFWDRKTDANGGGSVEPDLVVEFERQGKVKYLLIEIKWRARLSGDDQIHRQWTSWLDDQQREQALHLFIAPEISAGAAAISEHGDKPWQMSSGSRLVLMRWIDFRAVLERLRRKSSGLGRWAERVDSFLEKVGVRKFNGFSFIESAAPSLTFPLPATIFWSNSGG